MEGASVGSGSNRRSDEFCKRWIREQLKERRMVRAGAVDGATDGASNGSGSNRRSDEWCKR
jgi:hypothetical protein